MGSPGSRASLAWVGSINKQAFREIFWQKYDRNKFPAEAILPFRQFTFFTNWNLYQYQISDILLDRKSFFTVHFPNVCVLLGLKVEDVLLFFNFQFCLQFVLRHCFWLYHLYLLRSSLALLCPPYLHALTFTYFYYMFIYFWNNIFIIQRISEYFNGYWKLRQVS